MSFRCSSITPSSAAFFSRVAAGESSIESTFCQSARWLALSIWIPEMCALSALSQALPQRSAERGSRARAAAAPTAKAQSGANVPKVFVVAPVFIWGGRYVQVVPRIGKGPRWSVFTLCHRKECRFPNCEFNELTPFLCADSPCAASPRWRWLWLRAWVRALAGRRPGRSIGIAPSSLEGITRREHLSRLGSSWAIGITPSSLERITRREHSSSPRQKAL